MPILNSVSACIHGLRKSWYRFSRLQWIWAANQVMLRPCRASSALIILPRWNSPVVVGCSFSMLFRFASFHLVRKGKRKSVKLFALPSAVVFISGLPSYKDKRKKLTQLRELNALILLYESVQFSAERTRALGSGG